MKTPKPEGLFAIALVLIIFGIGLILFTEQTIMFGLFTAGVGFFVLMTLERVHYKHLARFEKEGEDHEHR